MHALGIRDLTPLWLCANDNFKNRQSPLEHLVLLFINIGSPMKREAWSLLASLASILLRKKLTAGGAAFLPIAPTRLQPRHGLLQSHRRPQPRVERLVAHLVDRRVRGAPPPVQRRAVVRREVARGVVPARCLRLIIRSMTARSALRVCSEEKTATFVETAVRTSAARWS